MENDVGWLSKFFSRKDEDEDVDPSNLSLIEGGGARTGADRTSHFPRFHGSATDQLRGFRGGPEDRVRLKLRDAFTPAQPVADIQHLAGRTAVLRSLIRSLEDQRLHVVLYGERGIGKTSLLRALTELGHEAQYLVRYTSCGEESDFGALFRSVIETIPLLYHADHDPTAAEIEQGKALDSLLPAGPLSANQISDLFSRLSGTRLLIILDEFDRSPHSGFRRSIAELIKNLSDRSIRVQLVIAGVASNLAELVEHIPSIRRNIFGLRVPAMDAAEVRQMIEIGENASGMTFDEKAVQLIISFSCGSPYLASLLGQHAGMSAIDRGVREAGMVDVAEAVRIAVDEIEQRVSERSVETIRRAFAEGQDYALATLARIAMTHGGRLDTKSGEQASVCAHAIAEAGLPYDLVVPIGNPQDGRYEFREEGLPTYLWMLVAREQVDDPLKAVSRIGG
ncbi:ATP-binding protein [Sphingobium sp. CAP-1]|uniref:ATP-binding protein n=1 Tax=Sphingobium sp. CAP-1 TaxID=2676077 RepID=UPI0012BB3F8A|nr:ATP-binding protein [Sphingobium sp. CAP-1]QGP78200.1 AAA family ATPase [Sphingobium sp. CAP-1]